MKNDANGLLPDVLQASPFVLGNEEHRSGGDFPPLPPQNGHAFAVEDDYDLIAVRVFVNRDGLTWRKILSYNQKMLRSTSDRVDLNGHRQSPRPHHSFAFVRLENQAGPLWKLLCRSTLCLVPAVVAVS